MTCTALVLRKHDLKLQSVVAINQTVLTNTLQMVKTNEYNTITYIKSSNHNIHWTQRNITYQRNSNKMSPASARSPTLRNGSNDATDKCTEDRRPVCRSTITKTKFKISQPKVLFARIYPGVCLPHGSSRLRSSSRAGQQNQDILYRRKYKAELDP